MRIAIDLLHPAHVHFFKNLIGILLDRGDQVLLTARRKDITIELLDQLGLPYETISTLGVGKAGLLVELITRDVRLWRRVRRFRDAPRRIGCWRSASSQARQLPFGGLPAGRPQDFSVSTCRSCIDQILGFLMRR